jgi:hypothetical protein
VYYDLSEIHSLDFINHKLSNPISRSTYYNYKKKLYKDEKYQSLKKSIYKSKLLKCLLLYFDENDKPLDTHIHNIILEKLPDKRDLFEITEEQKEKILLKNKKIKSIFSICDNYDDKFNSNLTRVKGLPAKYTLRKEYIRCGKGKTNKCKSCSHGPYFYAYWREKVPNENRTILRKKYLGTIDPKL